MYGDELLMVLLLLMWVVHSVIGGGVSAVSAVDGIVVVAIEEGGVGWRWFLVLVHDGNGIIVVEVDWVGWWC